jgi:hypothetical protein
MRQARNNVGMCQRPVCVCVCLVWGGGGGCQVQNVYRNVQVCAHLRSICWMLHTLVRSKKHACVKKRLQTLVKNSLQFACLTQAHFTQGVKANAQLKSSIPIPISAKVEISPQGLYTRSQGWKKEEYHRIWEPNLQPLGPMFQHLLIRGQTTNPKCSNLAPSFFFSLDS